MQKYFFILIAVICIYSCKEQPSEVKETGHVPQNFSDKWYSGKAEISSYALEQARYGEMRKGQAVLIFVTEDFDARKLVKPYEPDKTADKIGVLKMNMTKKFVTGIYPYSMMLSVFTPVTKQSSPGILKANCSSQEWCGHTFSQLTLSGNDYRWQQHSYFEKEGEESKMIKSTLTEDELWSRIRIDPQALPQGKFSILPGLLWQRLSHTTIKEEEAILTLTKADSNFIKDSALQVYTINYPAVQRTLQIYFETAFPYAITGWQETYPDGFGNNKKILTTKAIRKKTIWSDYWKHNTNADSTYTYSLQLMRYE